MKVEIVGKNGFTPSEANKEYCNTKLDKLYNFFSRDLDLEARVVCKIYREVHKVEITIPTKNLLLRAEVSENDLYTAIDKAVDKLITQVRKHKEKVKNNFEKEGIKGAFKDSFDKELVVKDELKTLVRKKTVELVPMSLEDAIDQMNLLGHDFYVYLDEVTCKVNVLYVRKDGEYAILLTK